MITILAVLFVLGVLIFVHELGHFLAARSVGVHVERFSLGFPPRLISFVPTSDGWLFSLFFYRKGEYGSWEWGPVVEKRLSRIPSREINTEYCVALIPLGGYVKMAGSIDESFDGTVTGAPDELASKNRLQQAWVMSAGVLMNVVLAIVVFSVFTFITGVPEITNEPVVMGLEPGFPAKEVGIQPGDRIRRIDGQPISTWEQITRIIHGKPLELVVVEWERDGRIMSASISTREAQIVVEGKAKTVGRIGISGGYNVRDAGVLESLGNGVARTGFWFAVIVRSIKMIVTGEASFKEIGGPIMIAQMAGQSAKAGFVALLSFMAVISVNLAFINVIPIPGLDGGHLLLILIEGVSRRRLSVKVKMIIQQAGMALLLLLILAVIYNDISRLLTN